MIKFIKSSDRVIAISSIAWIDTSYLEEKLEISVSLNDGSTVVIDGPYAIDAVMTVMPSVLEGRKFRFIRHAWAVHNLIGHPLMQILSWMGYKSLGLRIHDMTSPRPRGI